MKCTDFLKFDANMRLTSACEIYDKAITLFGMSKTFGMAGVRLGWLVIKDKSVYEKIAEFKDYTTICGSAPSEILSLIALRARDKIIEKHLTKLKRSVNLLNDFFQRHSNFFSWIPPKAGTICFPRILFKEGASVFCERVRKDAHTMLLPSTVYDYDNRHFRIGFGRKNMPEVLERFKEYMLTHY